MYSPITFFMLWNLWHFLMTFSHIKELKVKLVATNLSNSSWFYKNFGEFSPWLPCQQDPLYFNHNNPTLSNPTLAPSEMRGKVWTVKRVFISTNCSYFSNLPSPTPFFKNLFSYCNYCLLTLVSFFITRGLQNNLNNCKG